METTTTTKCQASPTKLRNGDWGARSVNTPIRLRKGDLAMLKVTTKAGKTWVAAHQLIWTDDNGVGLWVRVDGRSRRTDVGRHADDVCSAQHDHYVDCGRRCPGCGSYN